MYCTNCHTHFATSRTGFVVCPHCRHVNITSHLPALETYLAQIALPPEPDPGLQQPDPTQQPLTIRRQKAILTKNARTAALSLTISLVVGVVLFSITQNVVASYRVARAISFNALGQYADASSMLADVPTVLVLPGTRQAQRTEAARTQKWLTYLGYETAARQYTNDKKYPEALAELHKIPKDYPSYRTVSSAIQFATAAAASTQAAPTTSAATTATAPNPIITTSLCRVDVTLAPDLQSVGQNTANICQKEFRHIESYLSSTIYPAPHVITFTNDTAYAGLTSGSAVSMSAPYMRTQPDDMGAVVHELTHVVQAYPSGPGWLTEGIADYVRYQLGYTEPWSGWYCGSNARYTDGYGCAATMLRYTQQHYDANIIKDLHTAMRSGTYTDNYFQSKTGKTPDQIWAACLTADCAGDKP